MKEKVLYTAFILLAGVLVWYNLSFLRVPAPCEKPIAYNIGTFDKRFNLSQEDFILALSLAEAIWEKPFGKELFIYAPETSKLPINLIYDYRQETTSTLSNLEGTLEQNEDTYKALENRYVVLKSEYDKAKNLYDARIKVFNEANRAYERQVKVWNSSERTSKSQFDQLEKVRLALEQEVKELKVLEGLLNGRVEEINKLVGHLNYTAEVLNLGVKTYNTIGSSRGESFTGGVYYNADGEQGIDIYEFSSRDKLVRILAHEFGHALGLEHNDDPEAIMYYLNRGDAKTITKTDMTALKALCEVE